MNQQPDPVFVIPSERVRYQFCKPCAPLVFELGLNLVQCFVPTATPCDDLPFFIRMRPATSTPTDTRARWPIPMDGKLSMKRIRELPVRDRLKTPPNIAPLALEAGSLRVGVQQALLAWIAPAVSIHVCYTIATIDPDRNGKWRIEALFVNQVCGQWDAANDTRQNLLQRIP